MVCRARPSGALVHACQTIATSSHRATRTARPAGDGPRCRPHGRLARLGRCRQLESDGEARSTFRLRRAIMPLGGGAMLGRRDERCSADAAPMGRRLQGSGTGMMTTLQADRTDAVAHPACEQTIMTDHTDDRAGAGSRRARAIRCDRGRARLLPPRLGDAHALDPVRARLVGVGRPDPGEPDLPDLHGDARRAVRHDGRRQPVQGLWRDPEADDRRASACAASSASGSASPWACRAASNGSPCRSG